MRYLCTECECLVDENDISNIIRYDGDGISLEEDEVYGTCPDCEADTYFTENSYAI